MVDWSRAARNERKLMEAAEDVNQTHITDYLPTITGPAAQVNMVSKKSIAS